jgi:uncharacterized delta-60 repeat protein
MKLKLHFLFLFIIVFQSSYTQTVSLDLTFGTNGKVTNAFNPNGDFGGITKIQSDGKIIYVGFKTYSLNGNIFISRFNSNGTLDTSFGVNGIVNTSLIAEVGRNGMVKIQPDDKILITASFSINSNSDSFDFATARYNSDGTIDSNFGTNGIVITDLSTKSDNSYAVDLQSDGKIIVAGASNVLNQNSDFKINCSMVRYLPNGVLDTSFGINGKSFFGEFDATSSSATICMTILPDDSIVIGSYTNAQEANSDFANFGIIKTTNNGILNSTFGNNVHKIIDFGFYDEINAIGHYDGKIIALGFSTNPGVTNKVAMARILSDGNLDTSFGNSGKINTNISATSSNDRTVDLLIQTDGKIIASGSTVVNSEVNFLLVQFTNNGVLDTQFNVNGFVTTSFGNPVSRATGLLLDNNGKILVTGLTGTNSTLQTAFSRYTLQNLSISDLNNQIINVFPNPFNEFVNINTSNLDIKDFKLELFDILGKRVDFKQNGNTLQIENAQKGNYFLKVTNNFETQTIKLIKN